MIKLRDFLKIANDPVAIRDGNKDVASINDLYFYDDILSKRLLDMEVGIVDARDHKLLVELEGDIK